MNSSIGPRVVIDTNVLISGFYWSGIPKRIINLWLKGKFRLYVSPGTAAELISLLIRFEVPRTKIKNIKKILVTHSVRIIPQQKVTVCRDPKDNQFLELCLAASADYLITGDKDLLILKKFHQTQIFSPKQFLGKINK
ncbi:putative toxin-antitoxin system toxin component, PIN family [Candidatus Beckwithbacteria bacterium CG_4_10_14_0_2_um_filter_47_25]|uniref:Putative toxin-antitoxin system toxin component, PIN family n=3 Tax=Candidatus Beckwithiibacteriota TaxID=1752726 RepID=A0A1J4RNA5_9BACT|nr:MAG: putative toxin-antitoxin system toxin component, PIN family [Candidatus Beckwithbacteria bacterium CG1_02_47_37]PIP52255.1 MAG: putative toxin-antitoxin system toxin component, PIN family [Candidatus Beckwithbacteria bacterium CG23_combo_of_CG06-09_8_20_14_all_47_9]PJA21495.1 MAG: putative toxin-antitoxin system toxin component, PIN family [Candidatus Beckwithbacteria bacterium CG_4_10_14_0_2_um_filter_47_25]